MTSPHVHREAGRELDLEIQQVVMGVAWDESRCRICGWPLAATVEAGCVASNCCQRPAPKRRVDEPASYSTDIAAAWTVVERMYLRGWHVQVGHAQGDTPEYPNLYARFTRRRVYVDQANASTAPLAICDAALKAMSALSGEAQKVKT